MTGAVLDTAAPRAATAARATGAPTAAAWSCPECMVPFPIRRSQPRQLFCCREHKRAYNNRWLTRGAVLAPLYAAARATRGGTRGNAATGARARRDAEQLAQRWRDEDAAAGRMPVVDYLAERYRLGLVEVA